MGREKEKLTAIQVKRISIKGYYSDGDNLYLQVSPSLTKSWIFRYSYNKKPREMGLGRYPDISLAAARELASGHRRSLIDGIDPILARNSARLAQQAQRTFEECATEYFEQHKHQWKNGKHTDQWINTLKEYAFPVFGTKAISYVNKSDILNVLSPIWISKNPTAKRLKGRISVVLDWSAAMDYRLNHDSGIWNQIKRSLPKSGKLNNHHPACPYTEINSTINAIRNTGSNESVKNGIEFLILTAARTGEVRNATWSEIDFKSKTRIIPGIKMKSGNEHRVPLSPRAIEILQDQVGKHPTLIFPTDKGSAFSDMTFNAVLKRLDFPFVMHGFRSTFRDWCGEQTSHPHDVIEAALAHAKADKTVSAYFRSDLFEKRIALMNEWSSYCELINTLYTHDYNYSIQIDLNDLQAP